VVITSPYPTSPASFFALFLLFSLLSRDRHRLGFPYARTLCTYLCSNKNGSLGKTVLRHTHVRFERLLAQELAFTLRQSSADHCTLLTFSTVHHLVSSRLFSAFCTRHLPASSSHNTRRVAFHCHHFTAAPTVCVSIVTASAPAQLGCTYRVQYLVLYASNPRKRLSKLSYSNEE